jgi:N-acetylmuramoyl-L-alanine amidase
MKEGNHVTLVCIDPGHAASTPGKRSFDGALREYEFNRAVGKRLAYHLQRHGLNTMYSCDISQEDDASLDSRCKAANDAKADVYISIHANAYGTDWNAVNGWEVYYSSNSVKAKALADAVHVQSMTLGLSDRGVKEGDWYVIRHTLMPAVLVEHEFMTCRESVAKLKSAEWREKWAIADTKGILVYLGIPWKGGTYSGQ